MKHRYAIGLTTLLIVSWTCSGDLRAQDPSGLVGDDRIPLYQREIEENGWCWVAGPTSVSDLTDEEKQQRLGFIPPETWVERPDPAAPVVPGRDLPAVFDWRDEYRVTAARDQGACGSCWLFGATGAVEAAVRIYEDQEVDIAEQQVLSCRTYGHGCNGGWPEEAYSHYMYYGAIEESCMPYRADDTAPCTQDECEVAVVLDDFYSVSNNVTAIKNAVYTYGPVSTGFYVWDNFFAYHEGCYEGNPAGSINHIILIVGWDDTQCDGEGAWIIKNSWGPAWGVYGFGYVKYGTCNVGYYTHRVAYTPQLHLLKIAGYEVDDSARGGGADGFLDPGETVRLAVTLMNDGRGPATGVTGVLRTATPGVTVADSLAPFSDMPSETAGGTLSPHFGISLDGRPAEGDWIDFELALETDTRAATVVFPVYVGAFTEILMDDFESDLGWTVGAPSDSATEGLWERVVPTEKRDVWLRDVVQTGKDATLHPGTRCYVTENSPFGTKPRFGDVDGGSTTLVSPQMDLSDYTRATLAYRRWYTNDAIPTQMDNDPFRVDVSNDGGHTWTNLETLTETPEDHAWHSVVVDLGAGGALTDQMQVRIVATDDPPFNSVVEAAVDDIEIRGFSGPSTPVAADEPDGARLPTSVCLAQNVPNPFNPETVIQYGLPREGDVDLTIFNVRGQRVRRLAEGRMPAGFHSVTWDGRDGNGQTVAAGVYFCRLRVGEVAETRRMTLIH